MLLAALGTPLAERIASKEGGPSVGLFRCRACPGPALADGGDRVNRVEEIPRQGACRGRAQAQIDYTLSKIPMARFPLVEEIAALVAWLSSEECSFSTGGVFDIFRRQGDLSGSERPLDRRGALGEPAHSHPITRRDGLLRRHP